MDYGSILKQAWQLTKKHKWLWVYGLVLSVLSAGGTNFSSFSNFSSKENLPEKFPEEATQVLGQTANAVLDWFLAVPKGTWIIIGLGIMLVVILLFAVSLVIRNWAKGALIAGLNEADRGSAVTLSSTSPKGLAVIKPLIIFGLIAFSLALAAVLGFGLLLAVGYFLFSPFPTARNIWLVISGLIGSLSLLVLFVLFSLVSIFADRQIVLKGVKPWPAWKNGFQLARRRFFPTLLMGMINNFIGCSAGCLSFLALALIFGLPTLLLLLPSFRNGFHWPSLWVIITLFLFLIAFISLNVLIKAILTVFRYGTWNLFFKEIIKNENRPS